MSTTAVPSEYTLLLDAHQVVVYPQVTLLTVYLLYGVYILLFGLCVHILRYGPIFHYRKLYLTSTILLFFLSSTTVAVSFSIFNATPTYGIKLFAYTAANAIADSVLIHRCHVAWSDK
ncbi:hypothetical protein PM082_019675 [Marasmius tenuissimus]|nr:hypothetical protein PM082_019675 [Marasmius tenuissimus]